MSTANRVIKNTGFLYAKMGITMFISLYTTRLILNALGASDFGIFNVVGGAIAMLGFLHAAMSSATQRFMSYYEGKGDIEIQKHIFNISSVLHFGIALILALVLVIAGFFFFNGILNIPTDRMLAAKVIFGSLILSTVFTVMNVPYEAVLNAHENMLYYSIVGVVESLLKLGVALIIVNYAGDKLILYGILMASIPFISRTIMQVYCRRKYTECVIAPRKYWDKCMLKEMTSFAGWSFLDSSSSMINQYGLGIVLNSFFGPILNAAQGIANQVSGQLMVFSNNMLKALAPVIVKSEGRGNREIMLYTSMIGSKFAFVLLAFFAIPFIIETPFILKIWLKNIPEWSIIFVRLQLIRSLADQLFITLGSTINAQGEIKGFTISRSILNYLPILATTILFSFNLPPYFLYIVWILFSAILGGLVSLYFAKKKTGLVYSTYIRLVILPSLILSFFTMVVGIIPKLILEPSLPRLFLVGCLTSLVIILLLWNFFLEKQEKEVITNLINTLIKKF